MVQTVLFAASDAPDLYPFTVNKPKALVPVMNRSLIEFIMDQLAPYTTEWIVIVGQDEAQITGSLGSALKKKPIKYLKLDAPWTWSDALRAIRPHVQSHFLFAGLDLVIDRTDIKNLISYGPGMLTYPARGVEPEQSHISYVDGEHEHELIHPDGFRPSCFFFTHSVIRSLSQNKDPFPAFLYKYMLDHKARIIQSGKCMPLRYGWDLLPVHEKLLENKKNRIRGTVEPGVTLKGPVWIGTGTVVRTGAYIQGPVVIGNNCLIGPNCFIRSNTILGDNCRVGNAVEIKNCVIGNNTHISHLSYLGDSVIGNHVNIGAGNITANLRHDGKRIVTQLNGQKIETHRRKLGILVGDEVHTGIHNSFYPAIKIWPHIDTLPGQVISKDLTA